MAKAFVDGLFDDGEYRRQKEQIEFELASLVVPEADITEEVGKLRWTYRASGPGRCRRSGGSYC